MYETRAHTTLTRGYVATIQESPRFALEAEIVMMFNRRYLNLDKIEFHTLYSLDARAEHNFDSWTSLFALLSFALPV